VFSLRAFQTRSNRPLAIRGLSFVITSMALLLAMPALAATVVVVRPLRPSPVANETLVRLYGELLAIGFEVQMADRPPAFGAEGAELRAWLDEMANQRGADAVVDIVGSPLAVTVWVADRGSHRFQPTRVDLEPNAANATEQLAIQAIEVLRSSFVEMNLATRARQTAKASATAPAIASSQASARFGLELGAEGLMSLDGVGPAVLPTARFDWDVRPWLVIQAALAGLGTRPNVERDAASTSVAQSYGLLGARCRPWATQPVRPLLGIAVGIMRTSLEGHVSAPEGAHAVGQWSLLFEGNAGVELALGRRYRLLGIVHAQVAAPYVAIHFGDALVASTGRPNLLASLALGAEL
jgi:hypothetical protein